MGNLRAGGLAATAARPPARAAAAASRAAQRLDRGRGHGSGLARPARRPPRRREHLRATVEAHRHRRADRHDRPRLRGVRRVHLPARPGARQAAAGRRLGRPVQRAAHGAAAADRRLHDRRHQHGQARHRSVFAERERRCEAQVADPLPAVTPVRVAVLISGGGTNLQTLLDALADSEVARVDRVVSSHAAAGALERARRAGVPTTVLADPSDAAQLLASLGDAGLVVLAGYLKHVPAPVVARFRLRMINIHPALLPAFGGPGMYGRRVHERVLASGAAISGATVHYVDEQYDQGPIIAQWPVPVRPGDTPETLAARVLEVEHRLLPLVVLELARRGMPSVPVRLFPDASAFAAQNTLAVRFVDESRRRDGSPS